MPISFFFIIGGMFSFLAACIAFLITFHEYGKHKFEGWPLWRAALIMAVFTLVFFFLLSLLIWYVLG